MDKTINQQVREQVIRDAAPGRAARKARFARAHSVPLPGPLREAFAALPQKIEVPAVDGGKLIFRLVPLSGGHIAVLQMIGSPLMEALSLSGRMKEELLPNESEEEAVLRRKDAEERLDVLAANRSAIQDTADLLFVFTRPAAESRALLEKDGFKSAVSVQVTDAASIMADWSSIAQTLAAHYIRCAATALHFRPAEKDDGSFPSGARKRTVSAGS